VFELPQEQKRTQTKPVRCYRNPVIVAQEWQGILDHENYTPADLARKFRVSRARVTQYLRLLRLTSDVLRLIGALGDPLPKPIITERMLRPGYIGILPWSSRGRQIGFIDFHTERDRLALDRGPVEQTVLLDWTPCHFGGKRPWFRCPRCTRRVAVLCMYGKWFLCRHCCGLPYASQQETYQGRMLRKARKIRQRLGASMNLLEPIYPWQKPKGMHWTTFERLQQQEERAHAAVLWAMNAWLSRLRRKAESRDHDRPMETRL
jgi:hypothetical protein